MQKMSLSELASNIEFEAARFLHDNISSVKVDYHIIRELGANQIEVMCAVVKNDILKSFTEALLLVGLDAALVDVDYFSLQNAFEIAYPEQLDKTVCLINIGARFSSVNICQGGAPLYTGSIAVGGNLFTSALAMGLGIDEIDAERLKRGEASSTISQVQVDEIVSQKVEAVASDFNRQLGLFWNVSGIQGGIDEIKICGGGSLTTGLKDKLAEKTGISCSELDCLRGITVSDKFDAMTVKELSPLLALVIGMSTRQPGDKDEPSFL
jgi:type IV pilus assembly protein PilM